MVLSQRLESLKKRHNTLSEQIRKEEIRPSADAGVLMRWKKEKLALKDMIEGISDTS